MVLNSTFYQETAQVHVVHKNMFKIKSSDKIFLFARMIETAIRNIEFYLNAGIKENLSKSYILY